MTEKNNEIDVFESLAETMMFRAEDGEKMRDNHRHSSRREEGKRRTGDA